MKLAHQLIYLIQLLRGAIGSSSGNPSAALRNCIQYIGSCANFIREIHNNM